MSIARFAGQLVLPLAFVATVAHAQPVAPGTLLASTGNQGNSLISIDPGTGGGTPRCALGSLGPVTEVEYRADGVLFGATGQGSANIIQINPDGCAETLVGHHDPGAVNGLEFVGNVLYGAFFSTGGSEGIPPTYLVTVSQTTGALAILGAMGYSPVRGLAYDTASATMYGVGSSAAPGPDGVSGSDELFTVDLGTGATTPIGPTGIPLGGLEIGPDGVLYGGASSAPGEGGGGAPLVSVSRATGLATAIGSGTGAPALSGLAFAPAAPSVVEVPTLSEVGLVLLIALLGAAAVALLRRR